MNFDELFAQYNCAINDADVKAAVADILKNHFDENNNREVWMQCLNQIDLTTLNGEDTTEKVAGMAMKVNQFSEHFPGVKNVAAMCVYPALVSTAYDTLTEPIGIAAVAAGFPASQTFIEVKVAEAAMAVAAGATEIDIVISIGKFLEGNYQEVFDEISEIKAAIEEIFGVKVAKVNTISMQGKVKRTGAYPAGKRPDFKKAIVTLTADSKTIEFFEGMV